MNSKKIAYYYPKTVNYISAAIEINGYYLLLRNADYSIFNKYGYFFPGCKAESGMKQQECLKEQLFYKYRLNVSVGSFVGDVLTEGAPDKYACLYLYKCVLNSCLRSRYIQVGYSRYIIEFHKPEEFKTLHFDEADSYLAERICIFKKIMRPSKEKSCRSKKDNEIILKMYNCLLFFKDKIAKKDIIDFATLIKTNSTFVEVQSAYDWIIGRSGVDVTVYEKWLKKHSKKK